MTIKMPEPNFADRALKILGKKRGVIIPSAEYEKIGPYSYAVAQKENFFKALFRPANQALPDGMVDIHALPSQHESIDKTDDKI